MENKVILQKLETIFYPGVNKNIVQMQLIDELYVEAKSLHVTLITKDNATFNLLASAIQKLLKSDFKDITIHKKSYHDSILQKLDKKYNAGKTIAISSGKGGVGKSTIAANLSLSLVNKGYKVGLVDADIYSPCIHKIFDIDFDTVGFKVKNGIKILSPLLLETNPINLKKYLNIVQNDVWGELDYLIIDMPSSNIKMQLEVAQEFELDGLVLVSTPQKLCTDTLEDCISIFNKNNMDILGIVENMSYFLAPENNSRYKIFGESDLVNYSLRNNISYLGDIPITSDNDTLSESFEKLIEKLEEGA